MRIVTGNPVEGEDFFGRGQEQRQLREKLESDHVLMLAPRRVGKTSMIRELARVSTDHDFHVVNCSFAGCSDELDCIGEILKAIESNDGVLYRLGEPFKRHLGRVKGVTLPSGLGVEFKDVDRNQWRAVGEGLVQAIAELGESGKALPVICIDEIPVFVLRLLKCADGDQRARDFLNWFRDIRQQNCKTVRWLLAGSIGLDTVAARFNMSDAINDLALFPLGAFDTKTAHGLLVELANSYDLTLTKPVRAHIIERVGWPIPFYLQLMFSTIKDDLRNGRAKPTMRAVDEAFETLLSPAYKSKFDYWKQRLTDELGTPHDRYAILLLNAVCKDSTGATRATLSQTLSRFVGDADKRSATLSYLLNVLESDGYLVVEGDRYQFRPALLREFWARRVAQ